MHHATLEQTCNAPLKCGDGEAILSNSGLLVASVGAANSFLSYEVFGQLMLLYK